MYASLTSTSISSESMSTIVPTPVRVNPPPAEIGETISPAWAAFALLAAAVVLQTYGELWQASAMYALDFGLAPPHAQGQYQGAP